jgi:hypothetical protein
VIHKFNIPTEYYPRIAAVAEAYTLEGASSVRDNKAVRESNRYIDQWISTAGELAYHAYHFGTFDGYFDRKGESLAHANDGGCDVPGLWLDVKTSLRRYEHKPIEDYNLWVRPREYAEDKTYVQAIVTKGQGRVSVHLCGWALGVELVWDEAEGRYERGVRDLHPLPPHRWKETA